MEARTFALTGFAQFSVSARGATQRKCKPDFTHVRQVVRILAYGGHPWRDDLWPEREVCGMRKAFWVLVLVALPPLALLPFFGAKSVHAQEPWAAKFFLVAGDKTTSHDFGVVAKGAQLKYTFKLKNIYKVPMDITSIRVSCGCVTTVPSGAPSDNQLPFRLGPNEEGEFEVRMDARRFTGPKLVSIFVTFGPEYISTATLRVSANARQDVVFNPGTVNFGIVQRGQAPTQTLDVEYSGFLDWRITEVVKNASAPFQVTVEEFKRQPVRGNFAGQAGYRFTVTLKADAQPGPFKQELILKTNDPASPTLAVPVEGTVQASLSVAPDTWRLGSIKVGEKKTQRIIVRGSRPFKIAGIDGQGAGLTVEVPDRNAPVHILTINFQPASAGAVRKQLIIRTDTEGESVTVTVDGNVIP